jgi:integrase
VTTVTVKTWTPANVLRLAPPAEHTATEFTAWHPTGHRFGIRFRRDRAGAWGKGTYITAYFRGGRDRVVSLGKVGAIELPTAEAEARKLYGALAAGADPAAERKAAKALHADTFRAHIPAYIARCGLRGLKARYIATVEGFLTTRFPTLFDLQLTEIKRAHCAQAIERLLTPGPAWVGGKAVALQGRAILSAYFEWCIKMGLMELNPAHGTERDAYVNPAIERYLTPTELGHVWRAIRDDRTGRLTKLLVLTACRRDQIGQLRKEWLDLDATVPTITFPGKERGAGASTRRGDSKNGEEFVLPLARQAVAILRRQLAEAPANTPFVFAGPRAEEQKGYANYGTIRKQMGKRLGDKVAHWSLHDLRRTFATIATENLNQPRDLVDGCLNHKVGSAISRLYNRAKLIEQRAPVVQAWADYCDTLSEPAEPKLRLVAA